MTYSNRLGEKYYFKDGTYMEIIKYLRNDNLDIKFNDGTIVKKVNLTKTFEVI